MHAGTIVACGAKAQTARVQRNKEEIIDDDAAKIIRVLPAAIAMRRHPRSQLPPAAFLHQATDLRL
jgi:hypothetical protein